MVPYCQVLQKSTFVHIMQKSRNGQYMIPGKYVPNLSQQLLGVYTLQLVVTTGWRNSIGTTGCNKKAQLTL